MLYTLENYILFSLIYSCIKKDEKYKNQKYNKQKYESDILFEVFRVSLLENENIFKTSSMKKMNIIEKAFESLKLKRPRVKRENKIKSMEELFIKGEDLDNLEKKITLEKELLEKNNIKMIVYEDEKYPKHLKELINSPFVIYYKGYFPTDRELEKSLAIIGSRNPEQVYGKEIALRVARTLLKEGWWNISGLAIGCDEYGHKGSIGATGAILAQGLATPVFPEENTELANEILDNGGFLISELPPSIKPNAIFFILRDRLQSGLTKGIFVVETSIRSGTLHTVRYALEQNKKVFIWNPSLIEGLEKVKEVEGNIALLDKSSKKYDFNVSISKKLKENTISILNNRELIAYLQEITKEIKKEKVKESFLQNKLF